MPTVKSAFSKKGESTLKETENKFGSDAKRTLKESNITFRPNTKRAVKETWKSSGNKKEPRRKNIM